MRRRRCVNGHTFVTHEVFVGQRGDARHALSKVHLGKTQEQVVDALDGRALTRNGLMAALPGLSSSGVLDAIRGLRHRGLVYIAGYAPREKEGGRHPPIYALGNQADAREPSVSSVERDRKYRQRKRTGIWAGLL